MQIRDKNQQRAIRVRDNPLQRSSSVSAIIHGQQNNKCNHYIDALERFQRDFATIDKNQRENRRIVKQQEYERRRNISLQRQYVIKMNQQQNVNKMRQRQHHSQILHQMGAKITTHTESIAVNPISLNYEPNFRGRYQEHLDQQKKVNKLVRAHNLQTQGTSGYNIITGGASLDVESLVPPNAQQIFEKKIGNFYSKYKIGPANQN